MSDALQYSPEQCTIIATYKNLVIGVGLLSSPQETYITYLAVKPGWDNAQIATCGITLWALLPSQLTFDPFRSSMLYFLIELNPHKDITLHVSIKNPAVVRLFACLSACFSSMFPDVGSPGSGTHSFCTTASGSKQKGSSSDSTKITWTRNPGHLITRSGCGSGSHRPKYALERRSARYGTSIAGE